MRFDVLTLFPEAFDSPLRVSLLGKAIEAGILTVGVHDLRSWAPGPHRKVDDAPFGGGAGMVMAPGPVVEAVEAVRRPGGRVILLAASGRPLTQALAAELAAEEQVVLVCGRYEGMDDRIREVLGAEEVSIGEYVLAGGEMPALVLIEAVSRLLPGVMGNAESLGEESFADGLLEYPQYTRPADFRGHKVPDVLVSGHHGMVARWRREQALRRTFERRPDLLAKANLTETERELVRSWEAGG
ncbi:MAG TPA: tRNA (guanosine(37)-N1)-methyltransferase TrmD [Actinomycetota bacterium]|nr:tRNA (guanosine(37)-N1)-methyltransferase TrmD [Actinomycetota bacterium]